MVNEVDSKQTIYPNGLMVTEPTVMSLFFDFQKQKSIDSVNCYKLICTTEFTKGI